MFTHMHVMLQTCSKYGVEHHMCLCIQDRELISSLYEDWLSSGQNWMQSSAYLNASRTLEQSKRGTYCMKNRSWLVEKYGEGVADSIIATKRELELKRKPSDPHYVMENPDIPGSKETFLEIGWIQTFLLQSQKNPYAVTVFRCAFLYGIYNLQYI